MVSHIMKDAGRGQSHRIESRHLRNGYNGGNQNDGTNRLAGEHKVGRSLQ